MAEKAKRRWYQYSLKALLILMVIVSLPLGAHVAWRQYLIAKRLAEIESAFQWLESLDYPDMPNGQPVIVTTKHCSKDQETPFTDPLGVAFLLNEDAKAFTILTLSLERKTIEREKQLGAGYSTRSSFERSVLSAFVPAFLDLKRDVFCRDPSEPFADGLSERGRLLVLAYACVRHGYGEWAIKLYDAAEASREYRYLREKDRQAVAGMSFLERVAADFAYRELCNAITNCGSNKPRSELLEKFRWINEHFPHSRCANDVTEKVAILEQMVADDEAHDKRRAAAPPLGQQSKEEQIEELIYQLRDQPPSYGCYPVQDPSKPFERLRTYGYDAIPQLAAALGDKSLSRSIEQKYGAYSSVGYRVRTIGEIAELLLVSVAGRDFDPDGSIWRYTAEEPAPKKAARIGAMQSAAIEWHQQLVAKGETACVIEAIREGGPQWSSLARHLGAKDPDAACAALLEAAVNANDEKQFLISNILRWMPTDKSLPFLLSQLEHNRGVNRLEAAEALTELGRPEGVAAMTEQWQSRIMAELQRVGPFLVRSRQPDAIRAVGKRFLEQPIAERVAAMYEARQDANPKQASSDELRTAMVELLLAALADTEMQGEHSGYWSGPSVEGLRICDMAGYHLSQLDLARFPFDIEAPLDQREHARGKILSSIRNR